MPVRRLTRPPVVVVTGVENSGKTTLTQALADRLDWPWIAEAARTDAAVIDGTTSPLDLSRLLTDFDEAVGTTLAQEPAGILCDTGALVLDQWSRWAFHEALPGAASLIASVDLHILCRTLPEWEPDPLRTLPELEDRQRLESQYVACLESLGHPWLDLPVLPVQSRLDRAVEAIRSHFP